jgi:hypothetical protein
MRLPEFSGPLSMRLLINGFLFLMRRALRAIKTSAKNPNPSPGVSMFNLDPTHRLLFQKRLASQSERAKRWMRLHAGKHQVQAWQLLLLDSFLT